MIRLDFDDFGGLRWVLMILNMMLNFDDFGNDAEFS